MASLTRFDTPARVRDVPSSSRFYAAWSCRISNEIRGTTTGDSGGTFYDPTITNVNVSGEKSLTWIGFPRDTILPSNRDNRAPAYKLADDNPDTRGDQNEYFEWQVEKNSAKKITKVTFVTETPEYYEELWKIDSEAVVNIYRSLISPAVTREDLEVECAYNVTAQTKASFPNIF